MLHNKTQKAPQMEEKSDTTTIRVAYIHENQLLFLVIESVLSAA